MTMFISRVFPSFFPVNPIDTVKTPSEYTRANLTINGINILFQYGSVPFPLHFSESDVDVDLLLCNNISIDVNDEEKARPTW
jgi:hypothetical protein